MSALNLVQTYTIKLERLGSIRDGAHWTYWINYLTTAKQIPEIQVNEDRHKQFRREQNQFHGSLKSGWVREMVHRMVNMGCLTV